MDYLKTEINRIVKTAISTRARRLALVLSCLVIFVTTYLLILPAFTLEKDKALEQDGIDLPSVEETVDADADTDANANANANANVDGDSEVQEEITEEITEEIVVEDDGDADITDDTADEVDSLLFEGEDYTIAVSDESSVLPGDAELAVAEIDKTTDPDAYEAYCDSALAAIRNTDGGERVKRFSFAKLYDIALLSQGTEIEPQEAVSVRIDYDEALQKSLKVENTDSLRIVHFVEDSETGEVEAQVLDSEKVEVNTDKKDKLTDATFSADSFSVYAIVYTVDFHWNVDGEKFDHSLQGGGFISLEALVDALGIADGDPHEFAANVDSVKFSSPELVWVGKTDEDTTIGALKDANDLECEYSADLTDDDIADINDQTVNAGDWVLISMHPFDSEETLTVTMKNGDRFVINVTDIQTIPSDDDFLDERIDSSKACIICYQDSDGYHVLKTDGSQQTFTDTSGFDALDNSYRWNFYYVFKEKDRATSIDNVYYFIRPVADKTRTIALSDTGESLVQKGANNIAVHPQGGDGFILEGYDGTGGNGIKLWFDNNEFKASDTNSRVIQIYQQDPLPEYRFTVATDSSTMGKVAGRTDTGQSTGNSGVNQYTSVTNTDQNPEHDKTNRYEIRAIATPNTSNPNNPRYIFDHWELNGETIQVGTVNNQTTPTVATIPAGALTIPYNMADLKAVFTNNPNYNYTKEEKQGRLVDTTTVSKLSDELKELNLPLVEEGCTKTAEVYDYENRIYRVDLTSRGNLATFSGDIDLSFILDVSASMLFPSKLIKANESPNWRDHLTNEVVQIRYINDYGAGGRRNWQNWGFRTDRTYYLISDEPQTATVYKLWYDESNWRREDASKTSNGEVIGHETKFKEKEYAPGDPRNNDHNYTYQIYVDGDNGRTRAYYLEQSLNGAAQEMSDVRNVLSLTTGGKTDLDIKIAWNTFCNYITPQRSYNFTSVVPGGFRLNYDRNDFGGGTSTDIAILDAAGIKRSDVVRYTDIYDNTQYNGWVDGRQYSNNYKYSLWEINDSNSITYSDHIAGRGFQWTTENNRYAVLITDGAPQRGGKSIDMNLIRKAADKLKDQGVTLITIGLSMENVDGGSELLFDIANKSKDDNYPLFYSAKSGDELDAILNQIIRGLIDDAIVVGNITDKVGDAFYPVDKETGKPLVANDIIDLNGNFLCNGDPSVTSAESCRLWQDHGLTRRYISS